jgi:hypothetical protein
MQRHSCFLPERSTRSSRCSAACMDPGGRASIPTSSACSPTTGSEDATPARRRWRRRGRQRRPEPLPRDRIECELPPEKLPCPDSGNVRVKTGEEVSEPLFDEAVAEGVPGLPPGRRVLRLRADVRRPGRDRGRVPGPKSGGSPSRRRDGAAGPVPSITRRRGATASIVGRGRASYSRIRGCQARRSRGRSRTS